MNRNTWQELALALTLGACALFVLFLNRTFPPTHTDIGIAPYPGFRGPILDASAFSLTSSDSGFIDDIWTMDAGAP